MIRSGIPLILLPLLTGTIQRLSSEPTVTSVSRPSVSAYAEYSHSIVDVNDRDASTDNRLCRHFSPTRIPLRGKDDHQRTKSTSREATTRVRAVPGLARD